MKRILSILMIFTVFMLQAAGFVFAYEPSTVNGSVHENDRCFNVNSRDSSSGIKSFRITEKNLTDYTDTDTNNEEICNIKYSFKNGVLTFSGTGSMFDMDEDEYNKSWYKYKKDTKKIVIKEGITGICNFAFAFFENVTEISVADSVCAIGQQAFDSCYKLKTFHFPDNMTYYGGQLFIFCENLESVYYGLDHDVPSVVWCEGNDYMGAKKLKTISVPDDNLVYKIIDGNLYGKGEDGLHLLTYLPSKTNSTFNVPKGTSAIVIFAINDNPYLKTINLNSDLVVIDCSAINQLPLLKVLTIPASVKSMGSLYNYYHNTNTEPYRNIYEGCPNLKKVVNNSDTKFIFSWESDMDHRYFWKNDDSGKIVSYIKKGTGTQVGYLLIRENEVFKHNGVTYTLIDPYRNKDGNDKIFSITPEQFAKGVSVGKVRIDNFNNNITIGKTIKYKGWVFDVRQKELKLVKNSTVTGLSNQVYTGRAIKPKVSVKLNGKILVKGTDYKVSYKNATKIGKGNVIITGLNNYSGEVTKNFKINPPGVKGLKLTSPEAKQLKVTWSKAKGSVNYQIWYRLKGNTTWKKTTATDTSKLLKNLTAGKTYQVKVRAYKKVSGTTYKGAWTAVKEFKVK